MKIIILIASLIISQFLLAAPIHNESKNGNIKGLEKIISKNPKKINLKDSQGRTPIFYAVSTNKHRAVQWLISKGAHVNALDNKGYNPLCSSFYKKGIANIGIHTQSASLLIKNNTNIDIVCKKGLTPFLGALWIKDEQLIKLIWSKKPSLTKSDKEFRWLPIHLAARQGYTDLVKKIIHKAPQTINAVDKWGWNPIFYASYKGQAKVIPVLLKAGANSKIKDKKGKNIIQVCKKNKPQVKKTLKDSGIIIL